MDNKSFAFEEQDIDPKQLSIIIQRFQNLHKQQLKRIQDTLSPSKKDFLEVLPLLFHVNHPMLPGFVSTNTPTGVYGYHPSAHALNRASKLSKCFQFKPHLKQKFGIIGIYLMGSVGSIAYSNKSDFDIWLCHDPMLTLPELRELKTKADRIEAWTESIGLESHFFLMNVEDFIDGLNEPLSTESCGSIQHHLLLEEFYRTSLYIAGKIPAWWIIPPHQETDYNAFFKHLSQHRFIDTQQLIDFGSLEKVPADEFLGGTLWHLYKAIHAPHKSLLKLLVMESYASEYPSPNWLCSQLKSAIYAGQSNPDELDSYIYMYRKVEAYLKSRHEIERLELARECFYLKMNELLSVDQSFHHKNNRRRMMLRVVVESWGWDTVRLKILDSRHTWDIGQILYEQRRVSQELIKGYLSITRFAREHAQEMRPKNAEIQLLGRCLHCALERKPGKVEILNREGDIDLEPEELSLLEIGLADGEKEGWALYSGRIKATETQRPEPLKKAYSLIEILAWLVINDFYNKSRPIWLENAGASLDQAELKKILTALTEFFNKYKEQEDDLSAYAKPSSIKASLILVNVAQNHEADRRLQMISDRFDPFNFSSQQTSLIQSIDQVNITSWGEVLVHNYFKLTGLFESLCLLLNQSAGLQPAFECLCFSQDRSRNIAIRIRELEQDIAKTFHEAQHPTRFILSAESKIYCFEKSNAALNYISLQDEGELLNSLSTPGPQFSQVVFDKLSLRHLPLACIYQRNQPGLIQFFCQTQEKQTNLFILDERGGLFHKAFPSDELKIALDSFSFFINAMLQRYATEANGIEYYRIVHHFKRGFEVEALDKPPSLSHKKTSIRVVGMQLSPNQATYSVFCDELEFSSMDHGKNLFPKVAAHLLKLKQENGPIYISDIDLPPQVLGAETQEQLQTLHFLKYKQKIENRLSL